MLDKTDYSLLLCHVLQKNRAYIVAHPDLELTPDQAQEWTALSKRREQGEPMAYILGKQGFWKHEFIVTPATLIPRPETELIIETTLALFDTAKPLRILDLGTGSGAIAISLALESPHWQVVATDKSDAALEVAMLNFKNILTKEFASSRVSQRAKRSEDCLSRDANCAGEVVFLNSNWFSQVQGRFDLIVANPPYIAANDPHLQDLQFEPASALVSGTDGLEDLRIIISQAPQFLNTEGMLMVEHGYNQHEEITQLFVEAGFQKVTTYKDLNHHPRITFGVSA